MSYLGRQKRTEWICPSCKIRKTTKKVYVKCRCGELMKPLTEVYPTLIE